jgi:hypothetical protein
MLQDEIEKKSIKKRKEKLNNQVNLLNR